MEIDMKHLIKTITLVIAVLCMITVPVFALEKENDLHKDGYKLEKVTVLSRHNIRAPLSGKDSLLGRVTPHEWIAWSSATGELSLKGGVLETNLGHFFRKWLEQEGLIPENYHPEEGAVRVYSNAKQRTIATAQYFSTAMLPTANVSVEYHGEYDTMDPVFTPQLTFVADAYDAQVMSQIEELFSEKILGLGDSYRLIEEVIDLKDSQAFKDGELRELKPFDTQIILNINEEPAMKGSLKTACSISDALLLQYYEEQDGKSGAFGHELDREQWKKILEPKELFVDVLYSTPLLAVNIAHPLLQELENEMEQEDRRFSFLCGHDANLVSVMSALQAEEYMLSDSLERTPVGSKLVFSEWSDEEGDRYISVDLVYANTDQIRELPLMDENTTPAVYSISFEGLEKTADGMYLKEDFMKRLQESIDAYDDMVEQYSREAAA